jgi:single-strand DNA-binding protein
MSRSINKITLVGHVGRDPDVQTTGTGARVAHMSLATSRRVPRDGSVEERTEWHRLTLWDRLAEIAEAHIRKGDRIYVEGRMDYDSYERNGVSVPTAEVTVRELVMLGSPRRAGDDVDALDDVEEEELVEVG